MVGIGIHGEHWWHICAKSSLSGRRGCDRGICERVDDHIPGSLRLDSDSGVECRRERDDTDADPLTLRILCVFWWGLDSRLANKRANKRASESTDGRACGQRASE